MKKKALMIAVIASFFGIIWWVWIAYAESDVYRIVEILPFVVALCSILVEYNVKDTKKGRIKEKALMIAVATSFFGIIWWVRIAYAESDVDRIVEILPFIVALCAILVAYNVKNTKKGRISMTSDELMSKMNTDPVAAIREFEGITVELTGPITGRSEIANTITTNGLDLNPLHKDGNTVARVVGVLTKNFTLKRCEFEYIVISVESLFIELNKLSQNTIDPHLHLGKFRNKYYGTAVEVTYEIINLSNKVRIDPDLNLVIKDDISGWSLVFSGIPSEDLGAIRNNTKLTIQGTVRFIDPTATAKRVRFDYCKMQFKDISPRVGLGE